MKHTVNLTIRCQQKLAENRLQIHPNEGFDLGMMTTHYAAELEGQPVEVWLLNECPRETLEMHPKLWQKLGSLDRGVLHYDGKTLWLKAPGP